MEYGLGTSLDFSSPWGLTCSGRALCADGVVRSFRGGTADTFFSIPTRVSVKGRTVSGFVTVETVEGYSTATDDDPAVVKFVANRYGKNADLLPKTEERVR